MKNVEFHNPVMLKEVLEYLQPKDGECYLDNTFGAGGYSKEILNSCSCILYSIDRDSEAERFAQDLKSQFLDRFYFIRGNFSENINLLQDRKIKQVDAMIFDIGVSSMQLDNEDRGFSFNSNYKLDMRMNRSDHLSAYELVNQASEEELSKIIREFGEEPKAKLIAKKIVAIRNQKPITTCLELANIVRSFYNKYSKIDPATKTFQAIRIFINQEMNELKIALNNSIKLLKKNGRLIVVSFHSLEDQIVKNFLKNQSGQGQTFSRYQPVIEEKIEKNFHILTKSAISPSQEEIDSNPRCRSAKMRVAIKL